MAFGGDVFIMTRQKTRQQQPGREYTTALPVLHIITVPGAENRIVNFNFYTSYCYGVEWTWTSSKERSCVSCVEYSWKKLKIEILDTFSSPLAERLLLLLHDDCTQFKIRVASVERWDGCWLSRAYLNSGTNFLDKKAQKKQRVDCWLRPRWLFAYILI